MAGQRVVPSAYHHEQTVASDTWTIDHNLGGNGGQGVPIVDVMIDFSGELLRVNPENVDYPTVNTVILTFTGAQSGRATVIV
jgi:hypothetical protein